MNIEKLNEAPRLLVSVELKPRQGTRFQPTGFPDIGAATYEAPNGTKMLLVESAQSMANRMEKVCWDDARNELVQPLKGLPFVLVNDKEGKPLTNSILEAHRINSTYILDAKDSEINKIFADKFGKKGKKETAKPYRSEEKQELVNLLFKYDANALLHGVFMPNYAGGRCRIPRALSAFVEAENVNDVVSGGVKFDAINPGKEGERGAAEGVGNIPYPRIEYTGEITAFFNLDLVQIRNYGLGKDAEKLLVALALFKIRKVLSESSNALKFRTACDLKAETPKVDAPEGFALPTEKELSEELPRLIEKCKNLLGDSPSIAGIYEPKSKKEAKNQEETEEEGTGEDDEATE